MKQSKSVLTKPHRKRHRRLNAMQIAIIVLGSIVFLAAAAFGGYDMVMECYKKAVKNGYMFGCYGDSLLILPD